MVIGAVAKSSKSRWFAQNIDGYYIYREREGKKFPYF